MATSGLRRFTYSATRDQPLEASAERAAAHDFGAVEFNADLPPNSPDQWEDARSAAFRDFCSEHHLAAGIHTSSAVNNAEVVPVVGDSVEAYLLQNVELADRLDCGYVIVHGGYHFGDRERRREAALRLLERVVPVAEQLGISLWFENHNAEPDLAEIHYQPRDADETAWFLDRLPAATVRWAFNVAHAHLVPEGIHGFLDRFGVGRLAQVRLNDNPGTHEVHLVPGEGTIDFEPVFRRLGQLGYQGPFSLDFGTDDDKLRVRDDFAALLRHIPATRPAVYGWSARKKSRGRKLP